ncbi:MAG TPA: hypothetical protein VFD87_09460, partial [Phototrophicaceae bacterium]|nr:hypothetical protein [Phototrophicaceae bacterium]
MSAILDGSIHKSDTKRLRSKFVGVTWFIITILACHPGIGCSQVKQASWLDDPKPSSWNSRGLSIPAAPRIQANMDS